MKKLLCLVMLIMLIGISVVAEDNADFTFYGGVQFGMPCYDVMKNTPLHGLPYESELWSTPIMGDYSGMAYLLINGQTIAGVEDASMYVHMNGAEQYNSVVSTVQYVLGKYPRGVAVDKQQYKRIETMLTEKYGRTEYNEITGKKLPCDEIRANSNRPQPFGYHTYSLTALVSMDEVHSVYSCPQYSQWVVPSQDGYVIVEHSLFEYTYYDNGPAYYEMINYAYLTRDEYIKKIKNQESKMYGDL